jgi:DNA polymerase III epsilon subunit-like protein
MSSKITKVLAIDTETSGINFDSAIVADGYQIVSIGLIVADAQTFAPIEELYLLIKWNGLSKWSDKAESIHGLSKKYLEEHGLSEEEAAMKIGLFIDKHFGIDNALNLLGHNVVTFDMPFFRQFLERNGLPFKFAHRHCDTFSLSMGTVKAYDSNELFDIMGFEKRGKHNALEDARMSLKSYAMISKMWNKYIT